MTSSSVRYCFPVNVFSCWGTENSQMVPNQGDSGVLSTSSKPQQQTCVQEHCHGETGLPSLVSRRFWSVSSTTFQSPELLIQRGIIWEETMQLVSEKVELNAFQVSFLWHNSILVSLWTFQPTLLIHRLISSPCLSLRDTPGGSGLSSTCHVKDMFTIHVWFISQYKTMKTKVSLIHV